MKMNYKISHPSKIVNCNIHLPSSKSISNRLLIIKSLAENDFEIQNLSEANDTKLLYKALNSLENTINIDDAGSSFRFLTSFLTIQKNKKFILTGSDRLKKRPIKKLVQTLDKMGAKIEYIGEKGFAPLKISGNELKGGEIEIDGGISSQFISSLLLIAPNLEKGIKLKITGKIVSKPYILMTLQLMKEFKIKWTWKGNVIEIKKQSYITKDYYVESDWSAASFWFQIAALSRDCNIKLNGLKKNSIQGDKKILRIFKSLGVSSVFNKKQLILTKNQTNSFPKKIDLIETPDLYQPLKCTLFAKNIFSEFNGLETLKNKETDRVSAVKKELKNIKNKRIIETYNDHRMAMSFAPMCLKFEELQIKNIEVVNKSYPKFWKNLKTAGFIISEESD